ncbi:MAG: DUF3048 domain-containing protein [Patescibacteria group bacterium]
MNKKIKTKNIILFTLFILWTMAAAVLIFIDGIRPFFVSGKNILGDMVKKQGVERMLDGVYMQEGEAEKYPAAIMIDNMFEARPQSGITKAGLVFEAPVEGGITRFMAVFSSAEIIEKIGPVRSARPYFIDWAMGFPALYGHFGGSPEALGIIAGDQNIWKLNMDSSAEYFWRAKDRFAPHNAYTSSTLLDKAREKKLTDQTLDFSPWKFKDEAGEKERGNQKSVAVDFSISKTYNVIWAYNKAENNYIRHYAANPTSADRDLEGNIITAKNLAVMVTDITVIDEKSRRHIDTIGTGEALIFQDGKRMEATWEQKDRWSRLKFYDKNGKEIEFNRGVTWVQVVTGIEKITVTENTETTQK